MAKRRAAQEQEGGGTAVVEAPKRGRPRQQILNADDPAFQRIKEVEDLAVALDTARTHRQQLLADEVELQEKLAKAMHKHDLQTYSSQVGMCILENVEKESVKIKKVRQAAD